MNDIVHPHPSIAAFEVEDGTLLVGGIPLDRLAARVGQTPFFAYDRRLIAARVDLLRRHLPKSVALHYAIKANPMPAVVQLLAGLVDGFDVASAGEMRVALDTGISPSRISFAGPGKTDQELVQAIAAGITIDIESPNEMRRIATQARRLGKTPPVGLRINPDFEVKGSGMRMGGGPQQFGIDAEDAPAVLRELGTLGLDFVGFHIFAGSQNLRADILADSQERTIELALSLAAHAPQPVRHLNIGGGFGVPYFPKDTPLDLPAVGQNLAQLIEHRLAPKLPDTRVIVELGRYIVSEAGIYVARIVDRKTSRGQVFLITDGGLHHQLAASGNFGQVIRRNYPVAIGNRMNGTPTESVNIVGNLCTPLDLLAHKVELPRAEIGDLVVVFQSGAYGLTASPVNFLSHPLPQEILV
jgi:diaminopimelate decarboxylase